MIMLYIWLGLNLTGFGLMMWIMLTAKTRWGGFIYPELHDGLFTNKTPQWKKRVFDVSITVFFFPAFVVYYTFIVSFGLLVGLTERLKSGKY